ncbi:hypothetical protein GLOTRDRAFT_97205, partial [Gloeophyllum trabeum ATCC 11539]
MANIRDTLWDTGRDETVEVNQRALIDKVLARYSGEFTVFRELLQNSDDAGSSAVEIHFETRAYAEKTKAAASSSSSPADAEPSEGDESTRTDKAREDLPDLKTVQ